MSNEHYFDFEKPILEVVSRIKELDSLKGENRDLPEKNLEDELDRLHVKEKTVTRRLYRNLTPWQKVQVARHPNRPHASDYIKNLISDFVPLAGDRRFSEDKAMIAGIGRFKGQSVAVLGIDKGKTTRQRVECSFGMPKPEGYRKAERIMEMANKFGLPLITFIDTPGAFPGVEAEARGQSEAIASCIEKLLTLDVPVISTITGEGGSGGALAIAVADRVMILEHSIYSVISPEGCASILWRDAGSAEQAATALKITSDDLSKMGVVDKVILEPVGAAHRDTALMYKRVATAVEESLKEVEGDKGKHVKNRRQKFLALTGVTAKKVKKK